MELALRDDIITFRRQDGAFQKDISQARREIPTRQVDILIAVIVKFDVLGQRSRRFGIIMNFIDDDLAASRKAHIQETDCCDSKSKLYRENN